MVANAMVTLGRSAWVGTIAAIATLGVSAPAVLAQSIIAVDGSSTVYPITEAVAEDFMAAYPGQNVTVGISGTGGGFSKFCAGETVISNASRPIKESEIEACRAAGIEYIELPIAYDALTVVINPENTWVDYLTTEELRTIWEPSAQGTITRWNQIRPNWPDQAINLYGPGTDSGTFDYFTEAIMGSSGSSRADYTASEDDNVLVQGVARDRGALGYFGFAYYIENPDALTAVAIDNGNGPISPSSTTVENGTYQPLARPIFIYVNAEAVERPEVQSFVEFYIENAATLAAEVGYVPLPAEAYAAAAANFAARKTGSVFVGRDTIGVRIADLLQLETVE
jgi:phosphate transport system substrate-binding protein